MIDNVVCLCRANSSFDHSLDCVLGERVVSVYGRSLPNADGSSPNRGGIEPVELDDVNSFAQHANLG
jgi:hypothetical protein